MSKKKAENIEQVDQNKIYSDTGCLEIIEQGLRNEGKKRDLKWCKNIDLK